MSKQLTIAALLLVAPWVGACGDDRPVPDPITPSSPPPPPELDTGGQPLFELDTTTTEHVAALVAAPSGFGLIARLTSAAGQRELVLRTPHGEELVAAGDWITLATGAFSDEDRGVLCWNVLTGPESPSGGMPHPSAGLALRCRFREGTLGAVQEIAESEWLVEVSAGSVFSLRTYRDSRGWLYAPEQGDGHWHRTSTGNTFGAGQPLPP